MRSHCSPSLLHHGLRKVLSNQINSVHRCLSDKRRSVPTGNIPLPGLSLCSPLPATVGSGTQCLQCGRQQSPSFLPHSPFIVLLVSLVLGERRVRGSWPSFLKCQAPGGWWGAGGGADRATWAGFTHCSRDHGQILIQHVLVGSHPWLSGLPWNRATRIQPPVSREQSHPLPGAMFPGGRGRTLLPPEAKNANGSASPRDHAQPPHPHPAKHTASSSNGAVGGDKYEATFPLHFFSVRWTFYKSLDSSFFPGSTPIQAQR